MLSSVTDTLNYNWDCAYANGFPVAVEDSDVDKLRAIAQKTLGLLKGHNFGCKNCMIPHSTKIYTHRSFLRDVNFPRVPSERERPRIIESPPQDQLFMSFSILFLFTETLR
jgi:hypothetical protein